MKSVSTRTLALGVVALVGLGTACHRADSSPAAAVKLTPAPPAQQDSGSVANLSEAPPGAVVFELNYRVETGAADDIQYHSYYGYGGSEAEAAKDPFIRAVRKQAKGIECVAHFSLGGRRWSALEYEGRRALAFYFDLNADGALADNERIPPTRAAGSTSVEFITPDFRLKAEDGREFLFRVLLQASFYDGNSEPDCIWSPACVLEGTSKINGTPVRMILFANGFRGAFDRFGSSSCALLVGDTAIRPEVYLPRQTLSSLVRCNGEFYRVRLEGKRSQGHVARAVLTKDTSPTGALAVRLAGTNALRATVNNLSLRGVSDQTVYFSVADLQGQLPVGSYSLLRGDLTYGRENEKQWQLSFSEGPQATLEAGKTVEVVLGQPTLKVRAVKEQDRYSSDAKESAVFKNGTQIYLEPSILGKGHEVLTRFRRVTGDGGRTTDAPPRIRIADAAGKELLAKTMEYG